MFISPVCLRMPIDPSVLDDPEFKKRLYAVDDVIMNTSPQYSQQILSSPWLNRYPEFQTVLQSSGGSLRRYEFGLDCDEVYPGLVVGNA